MYDKLSSLVDKVVGQGIVLSKKGKPHKFHTHRSQYSGAGWRLGPAVSSKMAGPMRTRFSVSLPAIDPRIEFRTCSIIITASFLAISSAISAADGGKPTPAPSIKFATVAVISGFAEVFEGGAILIDGVNIRLHGIADPQTPVSLVSASRANLSAFIKDKFLVCHIDGGTIDTKLDMSGICYNGELDIGLF